MLKEKEGIVDTLTFPARECTIDGLGLCTGECGVRNDGSYCALTEPCATDAIPCYRDPEFKFWSFKFWSSPTFDQGLCRRTLIEKIDGASVTRYRITAAVYRPASGDANGCANPDQRQGLVILQSLIE
jgi:hypothetical protein